MTDDEGLEQRLRRQAELGRLLAAAAGYRVVEREFGGLKMDEGLTPLRVRGGASAPKKSLVGPPSRVARE